MPATCAGGSTPAARTRARRRPDRSCRGSAARGRGSCRQSAAARRPTSIPLFADGSAAGLRADDRKMREFPSVGRRGAPTTFPAAVVLEEDRRRRICGLRGPPLESSPASGVGSTFPIVGEGAGPCPIPSLQCLAEHGQARDQGSGAGVPAGADRARPEAGANPGRRLVEASRPRTRARLGAQQHACCLPAAQRGTGARAARARRPRARRDRRRSLRSSPRRSRRVDPFPRSGQAVGRKESTPPSVVWANTRQQGDRVGGRTQ